MGGEGKREGRRGKKGKGGGTSCHCAFRAVTPEMACERFSGDTRLMSHVGKKSCRKVP